MPSLNPPQKRSGSIIGGFLDSPSYTPTGGTHRGLKNERFNGSVKWYSSELFWGWIIPDIGGKDIFLHGNDLEGIGISQINEGQRVSYVIKKQGTKIKAVQLQVE